MTKKSLLHWASFFLDDVTDGYKHSLHQPVEIVSFVLAEVFEILKRQIGLIGHINRAVKNDHVVLGHAAPFRWLSAQPSIGAVCVQRV